MYFWRFFFFQAEDGIRDFCLSRGLGDVYKRQGYKIATADEIKALADEGIFLHYDSIKRVFEE